MACFDSLTDVVGEFERELENRMADEEGENMDFFKKVRQKFNASSTGQIIFLLIIYFNIFLCFVSFSEL